MLIAELSKKNSNYILLETIPGIGPMTATANLSLMGEPNDHKNRRQFAAFLGPVTKKIPAVVRQSYQALKNMAKH